MNNSLPPFGRLAVDAPGTEQWLELERVHDRADVFHELDEFLGELLVRAVRADQVITLDRDTWRVSILKLSLVHRAFLEETHSVEHQQERGAWYLPRAGSIDAGVINLPAIMGEFGRFGLGIAYDYFQKHTVALDSADAVFAWAVLTPFFNNIFLPLHLHGPLAGTKSNEEQQAVWTTADDLLDALGFSVNQELEVMRNGSEWGSLEAHEQYASRCRLLHALASQVNPQMAARYRAFRLKHLVVQYYQQADDTGQMTRRKVVTTPDAKTTISGFFGGDWLALLSYLGEQPHPLEQVVKTLPASRFHVGGRHRAVEIAEREGVPVEEIVKIASALFK